MEMQTMLEFPNTNSKCWPPTFKKEVPFTAMETETEDSELQLGTSKTLLKVEVHFNPVGWCSDMAGLNLNGIQKYIIKSAWLIVEKGWSTLRQQPKKDIYLF